MIEIENLDERLLAIRGVVQGLPQANFDILRRVAEHLDKVTDYEEYNQMTVDALAIVFSPNLLRAPQNNFAMILSNMGLSHKLVKAFVTHVRQFNPSPATFAYPFDIVPSHLRAVRCRTR